MRNILVHRIVCQAFHPIDNPQEMCVDHIDNNRTRNCQSNLRWVTKKFNNSRKHAKMMKSKNYSTKTHPDEFVKATNKKTGEIRYFKNGLKAAQELNLDSSPVHRVLAGQGFSVHGWLFTYIGRDAPECEEMRQKVNEELESRYKREVDRRLNEKARTKARRIYLRGLSKKHGVSWKRVVQIDKDGWIVNEWENASQAVAELGFPIRKCLIGDVEEIKGMRFKYLVVHLEETQGK